MRKLSLLCALISLAALASADPAALSLDRALSTALEYNVDLKSSRITLGLSEAEAASAWNAFLPSLSLSGRVSSTHALPGSGVEIDPDKATSATVSGSANLSLQLGVGETIRQKGLAKDAAMVTYRKAVAALEVSVKKAYFNLVTQEKSLEVSSQNLELAREQERLVRENYQSGLSSELDYLSAQYTRASLEPDLLSLRQSHAAAIKAFNILLGLPLGTELSLTDSVEAEVPAVTMPASLDPYVERRADVASAYYALETAKSQRLAATINRYAPTISLSESVSATGTPPGELEAPKTGNLSLSVSIPLDGYIPGSSTLLTAKKNDGAVEKAQIALDSARTAARKEIETLFAAQDQLRETVRLTQFNEKIALRKFELSRQGYDSGLVTQASLDEARQNHLSAQLKVLSAQNALKQGIIDLAYAMGTDETSLYDKE